MTIERRKQVAQELLECLRTSDGARLATLHAPGAIIETIGSMAVSARKPIEHVVKEVDVLRQIFPAGMDQQLVTMTAEGDRVVIEYLGRNTTLEGETYNNHYMSILEFEGDLIREWREYQDTALVERVLIPTFKRLGVVANPDD